MNINWRVRLKNPVWWTQVLGTVLLTALSHNAMEPMHLNSWAALWELLVGVGSNPYLLGLCILAVWNAVNDPTTAGAGDSALAQSYDHPKLKGEDI